MHEEGRGSDLFYPFDVLEAVFDEVLNNPADKRFNNLAYTREGGDQYQGPDLLPGCESCCGAAS